MSIDLRRLPPELLERARAIATGEHVAATPRHAATVVLLRDASGGGVEVYLLKRLAGMAFAGGMWVFPGGAVDERDADTEVRWIGPPQEEWTIPLTADEPLARALVCAAVRETFEEAGVLLAARDESGVVDVLSDADHWAREQASLQDRSAALVEVLARNDLALRADLLRPWGHWTTPELEPKRFDTRFFVAALPAGQEPVHFTGESDESAWVRPADALARTEAGEMHMLPPTAFTLAEMGEHPNVASVLDAATGREIHRVLPRIVVMGEDVTLLLPGEPGYPDG